MFSIKPQTILLPGSLRLAFKHVHPNAGGTVLDVYSGGYRHRLHFTSAGDLIRVRPPVVETEDDKVDTPVPVR